MPARATLTPAKPTPTCNTSVNKYWCDQLDYFINASDTARINQRLFKQRLFKGSLGCSPDRGGGCGALQVGFLPGYRHRRL
jgi:hypothetical protein